jgi:rhamnosyltransferase
MQLAVIIPTLNAGKLFLRVLEGLSSQSLAPRTVVVLDSGSVDGTIPTAQAYNARVHRIPATEFNHGSTRELGRRLVAADYYLFMTQDAVPVDSFLIENLLRPFRENPALGMVYARQAPWPDANPLEEWNRCFNYPGVSQLKGQADGGRLGLKTVFCSNVCAAYRASALDAVGGFPPVIMCEDQYVAARMIAAGYSIYYAAEAPVYHSHDYSLLEVFKRYFDLGVFFGSREPWIVGKFGNVAGEGSRLFLEGSRYLAGKGQARVIPLLVLHLGLKLLGYHLGSREKVLPLALKSRLSLHPNFWRPKAPGGRTAVEAK